MKYTLTALFMLVFAFTAQAVEPKNPDSICDRFANPTEKTKCETQMKKESPDWYLAGICSKQFDDGSFYECINLGRTAKFSPEKIQDCDNSTASDDTRLSCLREIALSAKAQDPYQSRTPAQDRRWERGYARTKLAK